MQIETAQVTLRKLIASPGYVFKQANGPDIYGSVLYLSIVDSPDNYIEIPDPGPEPAQDTEPEAPIESRVTDLERCIDILTGELE